MKYDVNKLPDFYSVRDFEQIDYSMQDMEGKKCYCFFDNGFTSNVIEPNKRDIRFIWDGFILFIDKNISLEDIRHGIDLYDSRLVALQRTNLLGKKFNNDDVRNYIISKLQEKNIPFELMYDTKDVSGYPSHCDLWSTRDLSVLIDAIDCTGLGDAFYFRNSDFKYDITFNESKLPTFSYSHLGAIVLRGENSTAISRLICNDKMLQEYLDKTIGSDRLYSCLEGKYLPGTSISNIDNETRSINK